MKTAPTVSIILPTYNRADTIRRAICSVICQSRTDWELLVIDDGSVDGTAEVVRDMDPRLRVIRQENAGTYNARNTGLAAAKGRFITFLDSDDEWLPHYLALTAGFLERHPNEDLVLTEFIDDSLEDRFFHFCIRRNFQKLARNVGSRYFETPPSHDDPYLHVYMTREELPEWASSCLKQAANSSAHVYRGRVFSSTRWGYLAWLPTTMITRHAMEKVGPFLPNERNAADYRFTSLLFRHFTANFFSLPCAVKHERGEDSRNLREDHLAAGKANHHIFFANLRRHFDELHWCPNSGDRELGLLRKNLIYNAGRAALMNGFVNEAAGFLKAAACNERRLRRAYALILLLKVTPTTRTAQWTYRTFRRARNLWVRAVSTLIFKTRFS